MAIDVIDTSHDPLFELVFRGHSDMAQERAGELGEEALNKVEPRAVLGGEGELEASGRMLKEFQPMFNRGGDMTMGFLAPATQVKALEEIGKSAARAALAKRMAPGFEVGYGLFSINGRMLAHGDPIRVKAGERVLFHIVNGSATETRSLALPGHSFEVIALDGNPLGPPRQKRQDQSPPPGP